MPKENTLTTDPPGTKEPVSRARELAREALNELTTALQRGQSDAMRRFLSFLARFHRYSFSNVLLIHVQSPDATHVAGFHAWRRLGRHVRKGEKGIIIFAPVIRRSKDNPSEATETPDEDVVVSFRGVYVFDVAQTDGKPLPEPPQVSGDPGTRLARLRALIADHGIVVEYESLPGGTDGVSRGGRIGLRAGLSHSQEFSVLVHEFAHELLHRGDDRPDGKRVRETEAEAVAFVVGHAIGLETGTAASDYIQLYDGKAETLAASFDRIQRTAEEIIDGLNESQ